jgi:hypothetical protein
VPAFDQDMPSCSNLLKDLNQMNLISIPLIV